MIILGIDPGIGRLGCAVLKKERGSEKLLYSVCLTTDKKLAQEERLSYLGKEIEKIIKKHKPNIMAIEKLFFAKNQKTALQVSEARGVVLYIASKNNIPVIELTPLQIKIALTGYGKAEKSQVQKMVKAILKLPKISSSDDEVDAIACAVACSSINPNMTK